LKKKPIGFIIHNRQTFIDQLHSVNMVSRDWERLQLLKQNQVRVKLTHLSPAVQDLIGVNRVLDFVSANITIKTLRANRRMQDVILPLFSVCAAVGLTTPRAKTEDTAAFLSAVPMSAGFRALLAKFIQGKYVQIAEEMKTRGVLQTQFEREYPPDWINPTNVMETHPIFSVQSNGDIVFRKVTKKEFAFLQAQENWIGKTGLNPWRWRGTLRRPLAPEVEQKKIIERLKELASRLRPKMLPRRKPVFGYASTPARLPIARKLLHRR